MYEIPVKIYNLSNKTKRVNIKHPRGLFKVDTDKKNKMSQISPGMHLEILVIFETDQDILEDQFEQVVITSENDFKLILPLKAYLPQPVVQFEPLINLGFVPVGTRKIDIIQFLNDGALATKVELKMDSKNPELLLDRTALELPPYNPKISEDKRKQCVTITFEPQETQNLHEKIFVKQITGDKNKDLGFIEIIATSVVQQMSIVFEEGGGPQTDINFGLLYHGQHKECSAFLVNNGPKEMSYKFFFHPNKNRKDFKDNYDNDDFASTPEEAGLEMTQRILSAEPVQGFIKPYSQIPIKFLCNTKIKKEEKGWKVTLCPEYDINNVNKTKNLRDELNKTEHFQSLAAVKFEEACMNKLTVKDNEEDFCRTISVYMEVRALLPDITIDKTSINFWECGLKEKKLIQITLTNMNEELPVDFNFNKITHFTVEPSKGILKPAYEKKLNPVVINVYFHPENIGKFSDNLIMKYVNNMYEIPIKVFGICKGSRKFMSALRASSSTSSLLGNESLNKRYNDFSISGGGGIGNISGVGVSGFKNLSRGGSSVAPGAVNESNGGGGGKLIKYKFNLSDAQLVPDELALDFTRKPFQRDDKNTRIQKFHDDRLSEVLEKIKINEGGKNPLLLGGGRGAFASNELIKNFEENFRIYADIYNRKSLANAELIKMRNARKYKLIKPINHTHLIVDMKNKNRSVENLMNLNGNRLESPRLRLPDPKDKLWVVKPIGQYEPIYLEENIKRTIGKTPEDMPEVLSGKNADKGTGEIPRTHQEIRECGMELNGADLQKIQVGCKELKFGQIFKGSERSLTFWVKNNHRNHIFVRLDIDMNMPDLQKSTPKSHVIAPGEIQGFKITVFSNVVRNNIYPVKYTINYRHTFKLRVFAEIILVKLEIQNNLNKFLFKNEKIDKDKVDMFVSQKLRFFNGGNAPAEIYWDETKEKSFSISPMKDKIYPQKESEVTIVFNPFESDKQKERYPEELKMNVINGSPVYFSVEGIVTPCKVSFHGIQNDTVDFEMVHTGVPFSKTFYLKNETTRVVSAYQIENPLPEIFTFHELAGYLTERPRPIEVIINYRHQNPNFTAEIPIRIRGGNNLLLKIKANIVQPEVFIVEEKFDFGGVSFNEPTVKPLTFQNKSKLPANVVVDLNDDPRFKDFKLVLPEKDKKDKEHLIKAIERKKKEDLFEEEEEKDEKSEENEESEGEIKSEELREFVVTIPPGEMVVFDFIFCPISFDNDVLDFYTDFKLVGADDSYKGLCKNITGQKIDSIITISDMVVKFPKTFIYDNEKNFKTKDIKIGSINKENDLKWEILVSEDLINEGIFQVLNLKGEILPGNNDVFTTIQFTFTPREQKEYKGQVTLQVLDQTGKITKKIIKLEGEGFYPRLYFDKRELILPIVPLGVESVIKFKVKNEGYENEELRADFESYTQGVLPVKFYWMENTNSVGYNKNDLKCEVRMISNKPITFTTKLIFYDKQGKQFPIIVAGTSDNCLFSNYSYFQRTDRNSYEFAVDKENKGINLKKLNSLRDEEEKNYNDNNNYYGNNLNNSNNNKVKFKEKENKSKKNNNNNNDNQNSNNNPDDQEEGNLEDKDNNSVSFVGSSVAKNSVALLGYNKINNEVVDQNCKHVKKYLKKIHLDDQFKQNNSFKVFPDDVVKDNGKVIYILIKNLIGKEPPGKITTLDPDLNKRAIQIREQYCQLIRFLQECGACLNTVFPEYLLDLNLYKKYIAQDKVREKVLDPKWDKNRSLPLQWRYYHKESWVLLVYQILKIFYLSRINQKSFQQAMRNLPADIQNKYNFTRIPSSNVYSSAEQILLKWINACFENINPNGNKEIITFSKDFIDSSILTSIILSYFPMEEKNLSKRKLNQNPEIKIINYNLIPNILKDYGIYTHIKTFHTSPNPRNAREMLLYVSMLFQNFLHFYPKDTIEFKCILGDKVIKAITLMNPTNKLLEYEVKYDGNDCFILPPNKEIKIEPGKESEYQITFKSKLSRTVEGKVYFINRKLGWSAQAAPIVYNLISNITGRRSLDYKIISTNLYSQFAYKLLVKVPFPKEKGEFKVHLEQKKRVVPTKKKSGKIQFKPGVPELLYKAFFFKGDDNSHTTVKFNNQEGVAEMILFFLPVELETYECNVIFTRESVGEFQYSIEGRTERPLPKKAETFEEFCVVDEIKEFNLEIDAENKYLKEAVDRLHPIEDLVLNGKPVTNKTLAQKLLPSSDKMVYAVESSRPYFVVPPTIFPFLVQDTGQTTQDGGMNNKKGVTLGVGKKNIMILKVKFSSKNCMVYEGDITIRNIDRPNDLRIFRLYVDVKPKDIKATLEFFCPLKETITQKIPIENKSDKDWIIKSEISGQTNGFFKVDNDKRIPKHTITDINLTFCPTEKSNVNGLLKLLNNFTSEKYFYTLIGNVEDPLAEGNIEIVNINAKETQKRLIKFDNPLEREIKYTVETDLDDVISGENSFTVPPFSSYDYEMKVRPLLGKIYFGRIIFRDNYKGYKWYTIRIEAKSQIQPEPIEMKTLIRKGRFIEINIENPTNEPTVFKVEFDQDLFLFGEKEVKIDANSSIVYKLLFAPLKVGEWDNVVLHIYNDSIGEFLYKLKLICEDQPMIVSDVIKAELGKHIDYPIMLENPTNDEVEVKCFNSRPKLFNVLQDRIFLPPGYKKEILVRYTPSTLETNEECLLKFETKKIGNWEFKIRGMGILPTPMEIIYVRTYVGGVTSGQVNFKNPFNERSIVTIELTCEEFPDAFSLFNKKAKYQLEPSGILVIPFTFKPQILTKYSANLIVYISKNLFWKYPIEGITEVKSKGVDFVFKTKSKKLFETKIFLDISNLPEEKIDYSDFGYILTIKEEKYKSLINKCLSITFLDKLALETNSYDPSKNKNINNNNFTNNNNNTATGFERKLPLAIKFYPLRPFKTDIEFVLRKKSGGQWIYNIILESTEPDPDDVIQIKSSLGKEAFVAFKLQNIFTKEANFIAYFSHDSSNEFSVSPKEGVLDQSGKEGTQFIVCFLPIEYGKTKIGKLIIETDDVEWIFEIRGTHLDYKPPEIKKASFLKQTQTSLNKLGESIKALKGSKGDK